MHKLFYKLNQNGPENSLEYYVCYVLCLYFYSALFRFIYKTFTAEIACKFCHDEQILRNILINAITRLKKKISSVSNSVLYTKKRRIINTF